jgi:hypothetical protein
MNLPGYAISALQYCQPGDKKTGKRKTFGFSAFFFKPIFSLPQLDNFPTRFYLYLREQITGTGSISIFHFIDWED